MTALIATLGDPTGIGPEVLAKALVTAPLAAEILVIGDVSTWEEACRLAGAAGDLRPVPADRPGVFEAGRVPFCEVPPHDRRWSPGQVSPAAGRAAVQWLEAAVRLALEGPGRAVVFAPLNKQAIMRAGYPVRDEYALCARLVGAADHDELNVIPHPADPGARLLWVARVTAHVPFRDIAAHLTSERVLRTIRLAHRAVAAAGVAAPRVSVAALNPHAGEGGLLGDEEDRLIAPAVAAARAEGIVATGPVPADHVFRRACAGAFDAVVAMYHDQAQIATKLLGFDRGVSVGVGYPFILATPSHGTAHDIAGRGLADPRPMRQALELAVRLGVVSLRG
ncbi:MAG: 4-hydroxythreonine-4-phosphate dehydrogenase PdxA [Armatimonadota bacterium]|nr:4-hydroxythreonine-4-phosphate dehydrogenase PdxA [Armatimonadota bacterium]MDR7486464.1 4-hydroxythreonine-4-phosphate dehydrogenase PdxA [Armatimonadota bacterium]MDR7532230.1 4-hydroxythreonine-4-phosphate dehydrogenase PdxA [Armatimonadota bacterium]MDR7537195.1 4-hydroxythreonine-4-phosphate dehydrogenase PdxA [Armatimonadota bacterium]